MACFRCMVVLTILVIAYQACSAPGLSLPPGSVQPYHIKPFIIDYGNGTVVRDVTTVPPSFVLPPNNHQVMSKDVNIPTLGHTLKGRMFIPTKADPTQKIPILLYFHGGGFCIGSAFSHDDTLFVARLVARAHVIAISVEYRLFPDWCIPAPYEDAWVALKWLEGNKTDGSGSDPWITRYGDAQRIYVGGDSSGANIAHNLAIRAGLRGVGFKGLLLAMPYFIGSNPVSLEPKTITTLPEYKLWTYVCPECEIDNGFINPLGPNAPSLSRLGCERLLVYTAELDTLRARGQWYYHGVLESGWPGKAQWVEARGKGHVFHIMEPDDPATTRLIHDFSTFLNT